MNKTLEKLRPHNVHIGDTLPPPAEYEDGDMFFDYAAGELYGHVGGNWILIGPASLGGVVTDGANIGGAPGEVFSSKIGTILEFRTLENTDGNVQIVTTAGTIQLDLDPAFVALVNSAVRGGVNRGTGLEVFAALVGTNLEFRTIQSAGAGVSLLEGQDADHVYLASLTSGDGSINIVKNVGEVDLSVNVAATLNNVPTQSGAVTLHGPQDHTGLSGDASIGASGTFSGGLTPAAIWPSILLITGYIKIAGTFRNDGTVLSSLIVKSNGVRLNINPLFGTNEVSAPIALAGDLSSDIISAAPATPSGGQTGFIIYLPLGTYVDFVSTGTQVNPIATLLRRTLQTTAQSVNVYSNVIFNGGNSYSILGLTINAAFSAKFVFAA